MAYSKLLELDGGFSLVFYCGELPADPAVFEAGHEPNGYFWEGVAGFIAPELVAGLDLDSEGGMFSVSGSKAECEALQTKLEPLLANPHEIATLLERAHAEGFEFDD